MSRRSPTGFVFSVAAEVIAVVFIVSVLPRVDLRRSVGASPTAGERTLEPTFESNESPPLLPLPSWPTAADSQRERSPHETSYYQRRPQPAVSPSTISPPSVSSPSGRELPARDSAPFITVDPARPDYVEQRLDRASQDLVNTVGSYVSQAANDLLPAPPTTSTAPRTPQPSAPFLSRVPPAATSPAQPLSTAPAMPGSFPTQPQTPAQPRPWVRY